MNKGSKQIYLSSFVMIPLCITILWGCIAEEVEEPKPSKTGSVSSLLSKADNCTDLLAKIQQDAVAKANAMADELKKSAERIRTEYDSQQNGTGGSSGGPDLDAGMGVAPPPTGNFLAPEMGMAGTGGTTVGVAVGASDIENAYLDGTSQAPISHSDTNVQVENVDEADIVKVVGGTIYLLHGTQLYILDAWPPEELSLGPDLTIEGSPIEMFVEGGRAVVYSRVYDSGLLGSDGSMNRNYYDGYYPGYDYFGCGNEFTKISLIDIAVDPPAVIREIYVEGSYRSGRLHGNTARTVIQGGFKAPNLYQPSIEYWDAWGRPYPREEVENQIDTWRERVITSIQDTELSDWLPLEKERVNKEIVDAERRCRDFYTPIPGSTDYGLTQIVMLDITQDAGPLSGASILGSVSEVYASMQTLLLAHPQWDSYENDQEVGQRTALHAFELTEDETKYTASGYLPGHILNQFSMDVDDATGIIRLATTKENWNAESRFDNRVTTLQVEGDELKILGVTPPLGHRDERIFATRFIDDKGYVVTFQQRDPLIVIDLSDPENLEVLGEAEIPGFSEYMHPLDDDHLLTIGRNTNDWGEDIGLQLQIFDVSDPTQPKRTHLYTYAPEGYSIANSDHKAFTYWAEHQLLAFPFMSWGGEIYDEQSGNYIYYPPKSSLEVFKISTESGFEPLGSVDHTVLMRENGCLATETYYEEFDKDMREVTYDYWACSYPEVRRGVFMDEYVYAISHAGVTVHELSDLVEPLAQLILAMPNEYYGCNNGYYFNDTMPVASIGGSGGVAIGGSSGGETGFMDVPTDGGVTDAGGSE